MNHFMLQAFSQRTVEDLKSHTLFRLALPPFQSFLDINLGKEVEKDRTVISRAFELHQSAIQPGPDHVAALLQEARKIDQTFLRKATVFPIDINIQYQDIEQYRKQRIDLLLQSSYRVFNQWHETGSFRAAVKALYNEKQFQDLLHNLLGLYATETHMLSRSIRLPGLLSLARDSVTRTITNVMQQEAKTLASALAHTIYQRNR